MSKSVYVRVVRDLELLCSSLCDRTTALISQLGLIKYIVIVKRLQSLLHNRVQQERCELFGSRE